jgi:signal transduction histidine kinase
MTPFGTRELALALTALALVVATAFVVARVLRALRHGFSVRMQIFLVFMGTTLMLLGIFGVVVFDRLSERLAHVFADRGLTIPRVIQILIRDLGFEIVLMALVLGLGAAATAVLLGRALAEPLERLTHAAEAIARGERHARMPAPHGREVRQLTDAFEHMRSELEDRHAMEQFVTDLSHELKNPVSAIRAACEVLAEGAAEDAAARPRFLKRIDEASHRLEVLVQDLLGLARLEAHGLDVDAEPVALDELVRDATAGHAGRCEARRQRVRLDLVPVRLRGSARWLRRAVDNLLSNALRYAPEDSTVDVTLRVEGRQAALTVRDRGPGVAPALRERAFERFVTDRAEAGGTGLGLAIVRSVAEQHGGDARLVDPPADGPGACIQVRLPLA